MKWNISTSNWNVSKESWWKTRFSPARLSKIDVVAAVSSDSTAQVLRNSRSEFRLLPLA